MKKLIFGPLAAAARGALRVIDIILNPRSGGDLASSAFPQPYSFHQPLFL